jgi:hypothetical protein
MGGCMGVYHEHGTELLDSTKKPLFSLVRRHYHDELFDVFSCPYLLAENPSISEVLQFTMIRQDFLRKFGPFDRSEILDIKFPDASEPKGPLFNLKRSFMFWGSTKNNQPHGWGEAYTKEGFCFAGYFDEGEPNYQGQFQYVDGSFYQGGLYRTVKDGHGKLVSSDGSFTEGHWKLNKLTGECKVCTSDGHLVYSGDADLFHKNFGEPNSHKQAKQLSSDLADLPTTTDLNFHPQPHGGTIEDEFERKGFGISSNRSPYTTTPPNRKSILKKDHQTNSSAKKSQNKIHFVLE